MNDAVASGSVACPVAKDEHLKEGVEGGNGNYTAAYLFCSFVHLLRLAAAQYCYGALLVADVFLQKPAWGISFRFR